MLRPETLDTPALTLTADQIEADATIKAETRPEMASRACQVLIKALDYIALRDGCEEVLPYRLWQRLSSVGLMKQPNRRERFATPEEWARLWHATEDLRPVWWLYFQTALTTGLRKTEIATLTR